MDPEEQELLSDYRYRSYSSVIEKALRNFESSSEWADLISSLGKLNKALQSNLKYSLLPKRLIIGKRLAQCLHPALPSGVHLKALETYEVIFKIIGTKWLAKDLFIYSSGLFPLLGHAAMSVKPALLTLYERYYLPLQKSLLPSLQAFVTGLLPGLEEGLEVYDRTDALLVKLSLLVGQKVFYGALWGSVLISPVVRLPASLFIVNHFNRVESGRKQNYMLGMDYKLLMKSISLSLQDSNVLVQRNMLEILLFFFPFCACLDPEESSIPLTRREMVNVVSSASLTLLRRDMSLNRRLYAWLLGTDIKGGMLAPDPHLSTSMEDHAAYYFEKYSRDLLVQALINILRQKNAEPDVENVQLYLKPFRIMISLLDKPEIGPQITGDLLLEVIRAFYGYCKDMLGDDLQLSSSHSGNQLSSKIKENKNASEIIKTANMLISSLSTEYLWDYMTRCFESCLSMGISEDQSATRLNDRSPLPSVSELCTLIMFLLDVIPLELYSEIQTQYLPQMLNNMLQALHEHMGSLRLPELTQGLRTCFKVLSKIQMPVAYMDIEVEPLAQENQDLEETLQDEKPEKEKEVEEEEEEEVAKEQDREVVALNGAAEPDAELTEEAPYAPLRSEDSGLGLSASPSEHFHSNGTSSGAAGAGVSPEREDVWKKGGSVQHMARCVQDILAAFISRYLLAPVEVEKREAENRPASPPSQGSKAARSPKSWEPGPISMPQFKEKLTGFFNPSKQKQVPPQEEKKDIPAAGAWATGYVPRSKAEISDHCRQAFAATCQLLLECTTFPVYLSEEETEVLYTAVFQELSNGEGSLPMWLKSLMTLCCFVKDCHIQNVAISTLLELVNHSQSLALVIQDKNRRYKSSDNNPFCGRLQMVTVPPINPGVLQVMAEKTDFYLRVAQVLWNQLNMEHREHHITGVELFYKLHCLAPSSSICEDIICLALLHRDKTNRLEALYRFSVLWHLTREIQSSRSMSLNRSFDRSLFVVLDSLNSQDGAISAAAQSWLVRAFSLNDVVRILEPVLLLLLHPRTQRSAIHCIKQNLTLGNLKVLNSRERACSKDTFSDLADSCSLDESILSRMTTVDREALWAEVERIPEMVRLSQEPVEDKRSEDSFSPQDDEGDGPELAEGREDCDEDSEHTESADSSGAQISTENTSSASALYLQHPDDSNGMDDDDEGRPVGGSGNPRKGQCENSCLPAMYRIDSQRTQASESLSSDDEEQELEAMARMRLLKRQKEKREMIDSLFKHVLLYLQPYDSTRVLYAFSVLETVLKTNPRDFVEAVSTTSMDTSSTAHLNLIYNLLARHQEALVGQSFYGCLQPQSPVSCPYSLLIELLTYLCLSFLRSYYPRYLTVSHRDLLGNRDVQVKSVEVLIRLMSQLVMVAKSQEEKNVDFIRKLLSSCKVQQYVLLSLSASMYVNQKPAQPDKSEELLEDGLFEESLINFGQDQIWSEHPLQIELLKILQVLIVLEHHLRGRTAEEQEASSPLAKEWQTAVHFQQSIKALQYIPAQPITSQGMFVSAVVRALQPQYGYGMHPPWVSLLTSSLPYLGRSLGMTVAPFIAQICKNLDELVKQYEYESVKTTPGFSSKRENIAPDYPLTLLEGLTTITHFCLLETSSTHRKAPVSTDPGDVRNARNAIVEELPRITNTMALLWGVLRKEESQRKSSEAALGTSKNTSTSVYFKSTKILRQRVLEFLNPLTPQYGVQLMAAVAAVWNSRKGRKSYSKNKILPVPGEPQLTIVALVKALSTLRADTILQLVKEVVKKPHQIKGDQKSTLVDIPMLQFSYAFMEGVSAQTLQENTTPLLSLLKESVQLNLAPPGHFLLLGILNDFVNRLPSLDNKKDQRDLQEVTQKILEAVGNVAGSSLEQTSWLSRNLEVKAQPQVCLEEEDPDIDLNDSEAQAAAMVPSSVPSVYSVQALTLLAEVLAPLLDMVYRSDEKEKAVPLISRLMYFVFPYLKNHSAYNIPSFRAGSQLLSSLSGYAYTKRAWKKEAFDLFMDPLFFQMDISCVSQWKSIVDHLLTHEKTMFKDLMSMQSSSLKLFASYEQKAMLLKRQAFAIFSGELDQYHLYLPLIQERLTENLRVGQTPFVAAQMFFTFRVLLLRISPQHLTSLWPIMVTELIQAFVQLEDRLAEEEEISKHVSKANGTQAGDGNGPLLSFSRGELDLYLSACKFLDTALSFPPDRMPLFQMYRWAFVPEVDVDEYAGPGSSYVEMDPECKPHVVRIMEHLYKRYGDLNGVSEASRAELLEFPLLTMRSISSITQLTPFLRILSFSFKGPGSASKPMPVVEYPAAHSEATLKKLEQNIECEFLETMDN
ncbi:protein dopey-2 [Lepisosteus oculatus]|uniref:protein dopey-2 n=1 Tax=Lepisosteus oculatus TaxID=7918 RepID=UPI0035F52449